MLETALVKEPPVFEPFKFNCISMLVEQNLTSSPRTIFINRAFDKSRPLTLIMGHDHQNFIHSLNWHRAIFPAIYSHEIYKIVEKDML